MNQEKLTILLPIRINCFFHLNGSEKVPENVEILRVLLDYRVGTDLDILKNLDESTVALIEDIILEELHEEDSRVE